MLKLISLRLTLLSRRLRRIGFGLLATITTFTLLFVNQSQIHAAQQQAYHQAAIALIQHPLQIDTSRVTTKFQPPQAIAQNGRFKVTYAPVENENYRELRAAVQSARLYESLAELLNKLFILPADITIIPASCGQANAFYSPKEQHIIMCDELLGDLAMTFASSTNSTDELAEAMINTNIFIFFHELGHSLIDIYDLPVVGREEDAVDEFSTLLLLQVDDYGEKAVLSAAQWFVMQSEKQTEMAFWGEHALDIQRFYNIACLTFGKDPEKFMGLVESGILPESRAHRCPAEYSKKDRSWEKLLTPFTRSTSG